MNVFLPLFSNSFVVFRLAHSLEVDHLPYSFDSLQNNTTTMTIIFIIATIIFHAITIFSKELQLYLFNQECMILSSERIHVMVALYLRDNSRAYYLRSIVGIRNSTMFLSIAYWLKSTTALDITLWSLIIEQRLVSLTLSTIQDCLSLSLSHQTLSQVLPFTAISSDLIGDSLFDLSFVW